MFNGEDDTKKRSSAPQEVQITGIANQSSNKHEPSEARVGVSFRSPNVPLTNTNITQQKRKSSDLNLDALNLQLSNERTKREKLEREQVVLRSTYESQLSSLEQTKETLQQDHKTLLAQYKSLKYEVADLEGQNHEQKITMDAFLRNYQDNNPGTDAQLFKRVSELDVQNCFYKAKLKLVQERHEEDYALLSKKCTSLEKRIKELEASETQNSLARVAPTHPDRIFGRQKWAYYFGDVGQEPLLPSNIEDILDEDCPFWPEKKVRDTHILLLMPTKVAGAPFTLDMLSQLAPCPHRDDCGTQFFLYDSTIKEVLGRRTSIKSYWMLVTRHIIPKHHYTTSLDNHIVFVRDTVIQAGYVMPSTLEMATTIIAHHVNTNEVLYPDRFPHRPCIYARCHDQVSQPISTIVGGLSAAGISLHELEHAIDFYDFEIGVALARRL
ncbi:MAG: hypothetical protein ACX93T_03920 [Bacteroidota bacterium]